MDNYSMSFVYALLAVLENQYTHTLTFTGRTHEGYEIEFYIVRTFSGYEIAAREGDGHGFEKAIERQDIHVSNLAAPVFSTLNAFFAELSGIDYAL